MIEWVVGDILKDDGIKVIPVNIRGVLGAGLARQFREQFPNEANEYTRLCRHPRRASSPAQGSVASQGQLLMGRPLLTRAQQFIFFPTKDHWMDNSLLDDLDNGLQNLLQSLHDKKITSPVAFPQLGSGLGKLSFSDVRPLIERFGQCYEGTTRIYAKEVD